MEHPHETYEHESTIAKLGAAIKVATDDGNYEPSIDFIHDGTCRVCVNAMTEAIGVIVELEEQVRGLQACVYHTAPGEMAFGGEGWTWKQQARATEDRLKEAESELARRDKETADARERVERE